MLGVVAMMLRLRHHLLRVRPPFWCIINGDRTAIDFYGREETTITVRDVENGDHASARNTVLARQVLLEVTNKGQLWDLA